MTNDFKPDPKVFEQSLTHLWDGIEDISESYKAGKFMYICNTFSDIIDSYAECRKYEKFIQGRLDGLPTLEDWIKMYHGIEVREYYNFRAKMQATRKAWLESLIKEFSV